MAFRNRVWFNAAAGGTTDFGVDTARAGYRTPAQATVEDGEIVRYTAQSIDKTEWEIGIGTYLSSPPTILRTTVRDSSNGNAKVNFTVAPTVWFDIHGQDLDTLGMATFDQTPPTHGIISATEDPDEALFVYYDPAWTPADLGASNLVVWLTADTDVYSNSGVPATDGQTVMEWIDQSSNGYVLGQEASAYRPTFDANGMNGQPCIYLNPDTLITYLQTPGSPAYTVDFVSQTASIFVVAMGEAFNTSYGGRVFSLRAYGTTNDWTNPSFSLDFRYDDGDTHWEGYSSGNIGNGGEQVPTVVDEVSIYGLRFDGTTGNVYLNDTVPYGAATSYTNPVGSADGCIINIGQIGGQPPTLPPGRSKLAQVVLTSSALTPTELLQLFSYFRTKYNLWLWS